MPAIDTCLGTWIRGGPEKVCRHLLDAKPISFEPAGPTRSAYTNRLVVRVWECLSQPRAARTRLSVNHGAGHQWPPCEEGVSSQPYDRDATASPTASAETAAVRFSTSARCHSLAVRYEYIAGTT